MTASDPQSGATLERRYAIAIACGFAIAAALGLLIMSYRFAIRMPALIDDWIYATGPSMSLGDLITPFFHPMFRFRPSWEFLSYVEWRTFGAPEAMFWPNLYGGVLRMVLFCAAIVVVPGVVAATSRPRPRPLLIVALGVAAALAIFSSRVTDIDFLKLGTQEPLLVGSTICGAALLIWATGRLLARRGERPMGWLTIAGLASGFLLWSFGLYYKEASLALLAAAPFVYLHLNRRWRESGALEGSLWRRRPFQLVALAMLVPFAHVAIGSWSVTEAGIGLYGAAKPDSIGEWLTRLVDAANVAWNAFALVDMTEWRFIVLAPVALTIAVSIRRRVPWLAIGLWVAGFAVLIFQALPLLPTSRYLLPGLALFVMATFILVAELPPWAGWSVVGCAVALAAANFSDVRRTVNDYETWETRDNGGTIDFVAGLHPRSCPIFLMNLVQEQAMSMTKLVDLRDGSGEGPCLAGYSGLIVGYETYPGGPVGADDSVRRACADPLSILRQTPGYTLPGLSFPPLQVLGCRRFLPSLDGVPIDVVLRNNRLWPEE